MPSNDATRRGWLLPTSQHQKCRLPTTSGLSCTPFGACTRTFVQFSRSEALVTFIAEQSFSQAALEVTGPTRGRMVPFLFFAHLQLHLHEFAGVRDGSSGVTPIAGLNRLPACHSAAEQLLNAETCGANPNGTIVRNSPTDSRFAHR